MTEQTSKIQQELEAATDVSVSRRKDETGITDQRYLVRLFKATLDLPQADWEKLTNEAQDWFNAGVDLHDAQKDLPLFPDLDPPAEAPAATTTRRRASSAAAAKPVEPGVGVEVEGVTKRGKAFAGKITEYDADGFVLEDGTELDHSKVESIKVVGGGAAAASTKEEEPADEPQVNEPEVGDTVELTTKRGKLIVGKITELTDDEIVLELTSGDIEDFARTSVTNLVVKVKGKAPATTSRKTTKEEPAAKEPEGKAKKVTAADNGGVSATMKIRELIVQNLDKSKDEVNALMKKTGLEYKEQTLGLSYAEVHKIADLMRANGLLKK